MKKKPKDEFAKKIEELIKLETSIRNLLILQLSVSKVPLLDIIKAAGIRSNNLYKIIPKGKKSSKKKKQKS